VTPPGTRWLTRRTLRWKLTAGLVVLLLATCTLVGVVTAISLRGFLLDRLDSQLKQASGRFSASLEHSHGDQGLAPDGDADNAVPGQSVGTLGVRLVNGATTEAAVVLDNGRAQTLRLSPSDQEMLAAVPPTGQARTVHLDDLGDYRVVAEKGHDNDVQLTGLPLKPVEDTVTRLLVVEGAVFLVVVLCGAAASAGLVRWTLRPLNRVAAAALDVSELPLATGQVDLPERDLTMDPGTEVGQVSVAFAHMLDHVETALRARNATEERLRLFIADASHELRTPLATIRSHAEYARRTGEELPVPIKHALDRVESEAIRMGGLVDDLLLLAQLDAGRPIARESVDITRLVLDAASDARAAGPSHRWQLDLPEEIIEAPGDDHRLHQVMTNLLANARIHTPAGTTVTVKLYRDLGQVVVDVSDDGPGIPDALLPNLFERFTRADSARTRGTGNTGLGLAIAFGIVAAHGGTLTAESRPGRTMFKMRLPVTPAA
jgi:two-component system OmpR family sensor kinase